MPPPPSSPSTLSTPLNTLTSLLHTFQNLLSSPSHNHNIPNPPNALSLLHDASSLLHAQTTKLSLLILNKPFTPSAISTILSSISSECLPGLMSVWEMCDGSMYSNTLRSAIQMQLKDVVLALLGLADCIPSDELAMRGLEGKREAVLAATGQIWQTCDQMNKIAQTGIVGVAMEKLDAYYALLKDAVEELEAWDPDQEEESLFGSSDSDSGGGALGKLNGVTHGMKLGNGGESEPPGLDGLQIKDMHAMKETALKNLKLIRMLFPALRKRRVSTFPNLDKMSSLQFFPSKEKVEALDQVLEDLKRFSDETDEVAGALYGNNVAEVEKRLGELREMAERCIENVKKGWDGNADEFSVWSEKWIERLKVVGLS